MWSRSPRSASDRRRQSRSAWCVGCARPYGWASACSSSRWRAPRPGRSRIRLRRGEFKARWPAPRVARISLAVSQMRLAVAFLALLLISVGAAGATLPRVTHDGRPYVELRRLAESLNRAGFEARPTSMRARLRFPGHVVTFTRNWSQILVNETPVVLDAPVRVRRGVWLVPESFVGRVLPRLTAGVTVAAAPAAPRAPAPEVALEELRFRSYPSFTRIVVETSGALAYRVEAQGAKEARIRLIGLAAGAQVEEIRDGFVGEVRVERAGGDALLRVVFEGVAGTARASTLADPHRQAMTYGVETYFLSSEATDSEARQVAAQENGVVQLESPAGRGGATKDIVKTILWDLAQSEFQTESSRLAEIVHDSMTQSLRIGNRGVKQAAFYVLGGAAMPAILIEVGFVTNPKEERRLKDARHRDEIARAIVAGLAEYKRNWDQRVRAAGEPALTKAR